MDTVSLYSAVVGIIVALVIVVLLLRELRRSPSGELSEKTEKIVSALLTVFVVAVSAGVSYATFEYILQNILKPDGCGYCCEEPEPPILTAVEPQNSLLSVEYAQLLYNPRTRIFTDAVLIVRNSDTEPHTVLISVAIYSNKKQILAYGEKAVADLPPHSKTIICIPITWIRGSVNDVANATVTLKQLA
jgi:heme/copper-type cytochrome/quinol oxidase subunit 2